MRFQLRAVSKDVTWSDLGFKSLSSCWVQYRLKGEVSSREIILEANAVIHLTVDGLDRKVATKRWEVGLLTDYMCVYVHFGGAMVFIGHLFLLTAQHAFLLLLAKVSPLYLWWVWNCPSKFPSFPWLRGQSWAQLGQWGPFPGKLCLQQSVIGLKLGHTHPDSGEGAAHEFCYFHSNRNAHIKGADLLPFFSDNWKFHVSFVCIILLYI